MSSNDDRWKLKLFSFVPLWNLRSIHTKSRYCIHILAVFPRPPLQTWSLNSMDWFSMFARLLFESTSDGFSLFGLCASLWKIAFPYSSISCSSATSTLVPQLQSYAQKSFGCRVFQLSLFQLSPLHMCQNQWGFPQSHYIWHTCQGLPWMRICMFPHNYISKDLCCCQTRAWTLFATARSKQICILGQPLSDACWDTFRICCTVVGLFSVMGLIIGDI